MLAQQLNELQQTYERGLEQFRRAYSAALAEGALLAGTDK